MAEIPGRTTNQLAWDVMMIAIDDLEEIPSKEELRKMLKAVTVEFHKRLKQELKRGMVPYNFGPVVEETE